MKRIKSIIKKIVWNTPITKDILYGRRLYARYYRVDHCSLLRFLLRYKNDICFISKGNTISKRVENLLKAVNIHPVNNKSFFYCIDCFKSLKTDNLVLGNTTIDYDMIVNGALLGIRDHLKKENSEFDQNELILLDNLNEYLERCKKDDWLKCQYSRQFDAVESIFIRPSKTLFEGLQRILFFNQFLWQTRHTLNGLGRLDRILADVYRRDIDVGVLTRQEAKELIKDFFTTLHEYYWFKSNNLLGDTGQIIILGGKEPDGSYFYNDLTYLFIEVAMELKFPDPKVLLRCASDMPEYLLELALQCISTGIGAPLLSNDDVVIPAMICCGFDNEDAYNYCTAACWEPLVPGISCDANNCTSLNFADPLVKIFELAEFEKASSVEEVVILYVSRLKEYIRDKLTPLTKLEFEEDPLLSLLSSSSLERHKDITRGGAKYNNLGLTSVGLGTVVNSILNINKLVFCKKKYSLSELNFYMRENFIGNEKLIYELKELSPAYGSDDSDVVALSKYIISVTSEEFLKYRTRYGGCFKIGLSSPSYIDGAKKIQATLDGRKSGEPFSVHISSSKAIPITELLSFAMKLDYNDNRLNGNVIDFFTVPGFLKHNIKKFSSLLHAGFAGGIFQLQMNVVDSKTLIAAKADPKLFPDLVVRVWGFSAYFNDLPDEYKDVLIARAIESEKVA